jgi:hypothetical protein
VQASHLYPICYQQDPSGFGVTHDLRAGFCKPDWETLEQRLNQFKGVVGCYIAKSLAEIKYKEHHSHGCHFLDSVRGTSQNLQQSVVQTCNLPGDKAGLTARVETLRKLVESDCSEIEFNTILMSWPGNSEYDLSLLMRRRKQWVTAKDDLKIECTFEAMVYEFISVSMQEAYRNWYSIQNRLDCYKKDCYKRDQIVTE